MTDAPPQRPETTCGFVYKTARKGHRCRDCQALIDKGASYYQDDYYAPFGNGPRYCEDCADERMQAELRWQAFMDRSLTDRPGR